MALVGFAHNAHVLWTIHLSIVFVHVFVYLPPYLLCCPACTLVIISMTSFVHLLYTVALLGEPWEHKPSRRLVTPCYKPTEYKVVAHIWWKIYTHLSPLVLNQINKLSFLTPHQIILWCKNDYKIVTKFAKWLFPYNFRFCLFKFDSSTSSYCLLPTTQRVI